MENSLNLSVYFPLLKYLYSIIEIPNVGVHLNVPNLSCILLLLLFKIDRANFSITYSLPLRIDFTVFAALLFPRTQFRFIFDSHLDYDYTLWLFNVLLWYLYVIFTVFIQGEGLSVGNT